MEFLNTGSINHRNGSGLLIVNELPLEEYLYAVIPSRYLLWNRSEGQAVCARKLRI